MLNLAPGWVLECPKCGHSRPAAEAGIIRFAAASYGKRVFRSCPNCRRPHWLKLYRDVDQFPFESQDTDRDRTWSELTAYVASGTIDAETAHRIHNADARESRKREIAAYLAEGLLNPQQAHILLEQQANSPV